MGLLDAVVGALGGGQGGGGGSQAALINAVLSVLAQNGAGGSGLGALVDRFQRGGLGDVIGSWVSTGQNLPVSPTQLQDVLGSDMLGELAGKLGLSPGDASAQLSQWLPQVVDQLTPEGRVPDDGEVGLGDIGAILARFGQR